jgi:hypothetical protein
LRTGNLGFAEALLFGVVRPAPFRCERFFARSAPREAALPPALRATGFLRGGRAALPERRAGRLAVRVVLAPGRALGLALAADFLAGLDLLAMVVLIGAPQGAQLVTYPEMGAPRENFKV